MKKVIVIIFILSIGSSISAQPKVHAFLFCNTFDPVIGKGVRANFFSMSSRIYEVSRAVGYKYQDHYLINNDYSFINVDSVLKAAKIDTSDIVFLYFSTHGGMRVSDTGNFPRLVIPDSLIPAYTIHRRMLAKHPRSLITIIEACSGFIKTNSQEDFILRQGVNNEPVVSPATDSVSLQQLFSAPCNIIVTAGERGKDTYTTSGGSFFTNSFLQAWTYFVSLPPEKRYLITWGNILLQARQNTFQVTSNSKKHPPYAPVWETSCDIDNRIVPQSLRDSAVPRVTDITFDIHTKSAWWRFSTPHTTVLRILYDTTKYHVDSVTYYLHETFKEPIVTVPNRGDNFFRYKLGVWGTFPVKARIFFTKGYYLDLYKNFDFDNRVYEQQGSAYISLSTMVK